MRLRSLEIKGFKSFANETIIHFNENVIGIVGPNGSGKSNVVDAIRWVLGEQKSTELRLDKMNSVIFNGTKKRKAGQFAQVTLTFDNTKNILPTEYTSLAISRILYASSESEYRLNGVTCRLKDITTLFMDSGIGSNSYSIIALNMVDDILNDKMNFRRSMLEQAAGVSKYKARKHETTNKLAATEEDLNRVEDLLHEIKSNLKKLESQAKHAQRYFDIKAQYKNLSLDLAAYKLSKLHKNIASTEKDLNDASDEYRQSDINALTLETQIEQVKKDNIEFEQKLSDSQRDLNKTVYELREAENDKRATIQKIDFTDQNLRRLNEQRNAALRKSEQSRAELSGYEHDYNTEQKIEVRLIADLESAKKDLEKIRAEQNNFKSERDNFIATQQQSERAIFEFEKQIAVNRNRIDSLKNDLQISFQKNTQQVAEREKLSTRLTDFQTEETKQNDLVKIIETSEENRLTNIEKYQKQLDELVKQSAQIHRRLDAKRNEFKLTLSMVENLEGFPESIKFLNNPKNGQKNLPLLGDLIYVPEAYRTAIEVFLEPYLNYYVAQNAEEAWSSINLLKSTQKGKANFFLLDQLSERIDARHRVDTTQHVFARDVIQVDDIYKNLFDYLLKEVFIVANESDLKDATVTDDDTKLIAQTGAVQKKKFSIGGGSVGLFEGKKIGRKKNLEILEKEIKEDEIETAALDKQTSLTRTELIALKSGDQRGEMQRQQARLNQIRQDKVRAESELNRISLTLSEADDKQKFTEQQLKKFEAEIVTLTENLFESKRTADFEKQKRDQADAAFRNISDATSQLASVYNEKNVAFIRQQNKVETLKRETVFRKKQIEEAQATLNSALKQLAEQEKERAEQTEHLIAVDMQLNDFYTLRKEKQSSLGESEQAFFQKKNLINTFEDDLRKINRQKSELQITVNQWKDKLNDLKYQSTSISERAEVEFSETLENLLKRNHDSQDLQDLQDFNQDDSENQNNQANQANQGHQWVELEKKVTALKRQLEGYGEINHLAVEAFNEMKERFDMITAQRDDINNAKKDLLQTIKEIEETATAQFLDAFNTVRLSFIEVFKSLFDSEDTADLILTTPDNVLESSIGIVAKPKGKRPQSIAQLSGGEKTLTAIAFLFALYLYKPAPFCIFDEVDAPLDDANIEKFNRVIKKFSEYSQFIVITHNKATMSAVDVIYGVYMAEQGVSSLTPVDFRHFENANQMQVLN